jgi:hypothetical protein
MMRSLKIIFFLLLIVLIVKKPLFSNQPLELRRHFYYKIEKHGTLIGYAEEYLKPVKELPNLEVEYSLQILIGERFSPPRVIHFEKIEKYYVDVTYERMLRGEIEVADHRNRKFIETKLDFQHHRLTRRNPRQTGSVESKSIPPNSVLSYHRFLAGYLEKKMAAKQMQGKPDIIWSHKGKVSTGSWKTLNDTTMTVNGIRVLCHHFIIRDENNHIFKEMWTLTNSSRLIRSHEPQTGLTYELVDVHYKNYFESPFNLAAKKPELSYLSAEVIDKKNNTNKAIESNKKTIPLDQIELPLEQQNPESYAQYLEPIYSDAQFDADTLYQIGADLMRFKYYLDEVLMTFSRWSNSHYKLNSTLNKKINEWNKRDYFHFRESLALFSRICRICNIPTRFVRGIYCLSVVDNLCYNWIWIEISDGKKWYPWHPELPRPLSQGAEFIRVLPVDWDYVKNFKFTPIDNIRIKNYQFESKKSLF